MRELNDILCEADRLRHEETAGVVATIVRVEGSSYRSAGARMLIRKDGRYTGTISGGCLEGEVVQHTQRVLETGRPEVLSLEQQEGEDPFGFGSGCGGTVHVLLEPFSPSQAHPEASSTALGFIRHCFEHRQSGALATVYHAEGALASERGRHLLVTHAPSSVRGNIESSPLRQALADEAASMLQRGRAAQTAHSVPHGHAEALIDLIHPPLRLLIFGEEQDAAPLVRQARLLGWQPVIVGASPHPQLAERFPRAHDWVSLRHPEHLPTTLQVNARDAAVAMSHNYIRDRAVLRHLLPSPAGYVGALGARSRLEQLAGDFASGDAPEDRAAHRALTSGRLSGPVGLDIGAQTPEEIALSIAAEVQAVFAGCSGGRLSRGTGRIHPPAARPQTVGETAARAYAECAAE